MSSKKKSCDAEYDDEDDMSSVSDDDSSQILFHLNECPRKKVEKTKWSEIEVNMLSPL